MEQPTPWTRGPWAKLSPRLVERGYDQAPPKRLRPYPKSKIVEFVIRGHVIGPAD